MPAFAPKRTSADCSCCSSEARFSLYHSHSKQDLAGFSGVRFMPREQLETPVHAQEGRPMGWV